ncbi:MAG: ArnT family glycosyltransferase [Fimbriimonas sp.]
MSAAETTPLTTEPAFLSRTAPWKRFLPLIVFLVALLIRIPGIGWGLKNDLHNQSYHPDEQVVWTYSQQIEPARLDFTPGFYNYGTLYLSMLRVASDVTAAYTGGPDPKNAEATWAFVSRAHMAGRILSALAGAGTVLAVFVLLRRRTNLLGAVMGAALVAVAPGHVVHSRFQTVDVLATFFLAVSAVYALRLLDRAAEEDGTRDAVLAGLFAGLSAGTKYTGFLALFTLFAVLVFSRRHRLVREGLAGIATAFLVFLIVTPGALLEADKFWRDFRYEMTHTSTGHGLVFTGAGSGFAYHLSNLFYGVGTLLTLLGLVGLGYLAYRRERWAIALLVFFVPYFLLIGRAEVLFLRYTFPLYIGLAAGFGALMGQAHRQQGWGKAVVAVGILALGGVDSRGLMGAATVTQHMDGSDPRDEAVRYVRSKASDSATVGLAQDPWFWSAPFFPDSAVTRMMPVAQRREAMVATARPKVVLAEDGNGGVPPFDPRLVTELAPDFIVITSLESDPLERLEGRKDVPQEAQGEAAKYSDFVRALNERYELAQPYGAAKWRNAVEDMLYVYPRVWVWKRKANP